MRGFAFLFTLFAIPTLGVACGSSDSAVATSTAAATTAATGSASSTSSDSATSSGSGGATSSSASTASTGGGGAGGGGMKDLDGDGLDDDYEAKLAADYLPFLSLDPADGCPLGGLLYRVHPHPADPTLIHIVYDHLYEKDCGSFGHAGDNEAFGITVDPKKPAPDGILSMIAVSHQGTPCEQDTNCGKCPGQTACATTAVGGKDWPVIFASKDKHGNYAQKCTIVNCLDSCTLAQAAPMLPMVNAGEPMMHLTDDLTANGFITAANGWTDMSLFGTDPWDTMKDFGGAGNIAGDLVDMAFVPPACP